MILIDNYSLEAEYMNQTTACHLAGNFALVMIGRMCRHIVRICVYIIAWPFYTCGQFFKYSGHMTWDVFMAA